MATTRDKTYDVGGVALDQPFKIRRLGHFGFNVYDMDAGLKFYKDLLGFKVSDYLNFKGNPQRAEMLKDLSDEECRGAFMHHGGDHHSFVLFPKKALDVMARGGPHNGDGDVTINQITWQTGSLAEVVNGDQLGSLRRAVSYRPEDAASVLCRRGLHLRSGRTEACGDGTPRGADASPAVMVI